MNIHFHFAKAIKKKKLSTFFGFFFVLPRRNVDFSYKLKVLRYRLRDVKRHYVIFFLIFFANDIFFSPSCYLDALPKSIIKGFLCQFGISLRLLFCFSLHCAFKCFKIFFFYFRTSFRSAQQMSREKKFFSTLLTSRLGVKIYVTAKSISQWERKIIKTASYSQTEAPFVFIMNLESIQISLRAKAT